MKGPLISKEERHGLARTVAISTPVVVFLWLGLLRVVLGDWRFVFPAMIGLLSLAVVLGLLCPDPLGSLTYRCWSALVAAIDWLVTRVICVLLYFLLITPLGCLLRILGVSYARIGRAAPGKSTWVTALKTANRREPYLKQY